MSNVKARPSEKRTPITLSLRKKTIDALNDYAAFKGVSKSSVGETAITEYLKSLGELS